MASRDLEGLGEWKGSASWSLRRVLRSRGLRLCGDLLARKTFSLSLTSGRGDKKRSGDENQVQALWEASKVTGGAIYIEICGMIQVG